MKAKNYQDENNMEAEKKRIAEDLHDDLGSLLTGLKLSLITLAEHNPLFSASAEQVGDSLTRLREISLNLLPREMEREGFNAAVESFVERLNTSGSILISFSSIQEIDLIDKQKAMLLFRVIQEITANAIKHSGATLIEIGLANRTNNLILEIRDNGRGFDYELALKKKNSSGLKNIQSRLDILNAILMIESNKNGTHYFINVPLRHLTNGTNQ